jgi:hypothetical protein|tara:strand:- start:199 stop:507 length:309 start_codon:yes stop_codon:yes gene_type:complete
MPKFKKDRSKFVMKGFSPFTSNDPPKKNKSKFAPTIPPVDDDTDYEGYGRTQLEEMKNDIVELNKSIKRHSDKPNIVAKFKASIERIQKKIDRKEIIEGGIK